MRAIQRTSAARVIRASTEFVVAIQGKENQRLTEEFNDKLQLQSPDEKVKGELLHANMRVKTMQAELEEAEQTIMEQERTIRQMRSKFKFAFDLHFEKWNGKPEAANASIGYVPTYAKE